MIIDIHSHLSPINYEAAIKQYQGINARIIVNGLNPISNRFAIKLSEQYDFIDAANGIHPTELENLSDNQVEAELEYIKSQKDRIIAVGEIGLDFKIVPKSKHERHKKIFIKQLKLAKKIRKPVIVHSRYAEEHTIDLIKKNFRGKVILHSFTGQPEIAQTLSKRFYFGINPIVFRNENMQKIVEKVSLKRLFVETDYPFVCKSPHEIVKVISEISKIKKIPEKKVIHRIYANYRKVFRKHIIDILNDKIKSYKYNFKGLSSPFHKKRTYKNLYNIKPNFSKKDKS